LKNHLLAGEHPSPLAPAPGAGRRESPAYLGDARRRRREEIEDLLYGLPEREDLQQLYERQVPLDQIVRLMGRRIDRARIIQLLGCDDPRREISRILGSA
jgi:hypothetical protein